MVKRIASFVFALLLVLSAITGFFSLPQWVYFGTIGLILVVVFASNRIRVRQSQIALLILICALSLLINQPPAYFNAWFRLLGFVAVLCAVSPLFGYSKIASFRYAVLNSIMTLAVCLSVGSLICYFLGINFFVRNDEVLDIGAGSFSGLYNHSMVLGPMSALASIFLLTKYLNSERRKNLFLFLLLACGASTLLSASRAAVGGCMLGMVVAYMRFYRGRLSKGLVWGLVVLALLAATFPIWGELTDFVISKQNANLNNGGTFASRDEIFEVRLKEISEHPLSGVGFCCVDPRWASVNTSTGQVEPGSSWLAVFSMTGVFGFLTFISLCYNKFREASQITDNNSSPFFVGSLAFFFVHLMFEGYLLFSGSFLGLTFWLLLGSISAYLNK